MNRLKDKIAIVTGGANGIGRAICERFADEGAWVLVVDIEEETGQSVAAGIRKKGGKAAFCKGDVSNREDILRAVELAAEAGMRLRFKRTMGRGRTNPVQPGTPVGMARRGECRA